MRFEKPGFWEKTRFLVGDGNAPGDLRNPVLGKKPGFWWVRGMRQEILETGFWRAMGLVFVGWGMCQEILETGVLGKKPGFWWAMGMCQEIRSPLKKPGF